MTLGKICTALEWTTNPWQNLELMHKEACFGGIGLLSGNWSKLQGSTIKYLKTSES